MPSIFILLLLPMAWSAKLGKYVYVDQTVDWLRAQNYCRTYHLDLAPISSEKDNNLLEQLSGNSTSFIRFGLMRNLNSTASQYKWMWSGGGTVRRTFWEVGQPSGVGDFGMLIRYKWHDSPASYKMNFFCYDVQFVAEMKTWEEALQYCQKNHSDMASVASEGEMALIRKALITKYVSAHVWIGLRFLAGNWQWVDGQPLEYEAWGPGGRPWCPAMTSGCGALQVNGSMVWTGSNVYATDVKGWNARDCNEKLNFLCY